MSEVQVVELVVGEHFSAVNELESLGFFALQETTSFAQAFADFKVGGNLHTPEQKSS